MLEKMRIETKKFYVDLKPVNPENLPAGLCLQVTFQNPPAKMLRITETIDYPIKDIDKVNAIFNAQFPGEKLDIRMTENGSLIIKSAPSAMDLQLNTFADVIVDNPLKVHTLKLSGKTIASGHAISATNDISLKFTEKFDNFSTLFAEHEIRFHTEQGEINNHHQIRSHGDIRFLGKAKLNNHGVFRAVRHCKGQMNSVENKGYFVAGNVQLQFAKHEHLPSKSKFINHGKVSVKHNCVIQSATSLHNYGEMIIGGHFGGNEFVEFSTIQGLRNYNKLVVGGNLKLRVDYRLLNAKNALFEVHGCSQLLLAQCFNEGRLYLHDKLHLLNALIHQSSQSKEAIFINTGTGTLESDNDIEVFTHQFSNAGQIITPQHFSLCVESQTSPINFKSGNINARKVKLINGNKSCQFINYGEITGVEKLSTAISGEFHNIETAKLNSDELIHLLVVNKLINDGSISSVHDVKLEGGKARIGKEGKVLAGRHADIEMRSVKSQGEVQAGSRITLRASKFQQSKDAVLAAEDAIKVEASTYLNNAGLIHSQHQLFLQSYGEMIHTETSHVEAETLEMSARHLLVQGTVIAKQTLLLKAIAAFSQSATAKMFAEQTLQILSSGQIELSGHVGSENHILLRSLENLIVNQGAVLFTPATVKLFSGNKLVIGSKITAEQAIFMEAIQSLTLHAEALVRAKRVEVTAGYFTNGGAIHADELTINTAHAFANLLGAALVAGSQLELNANSAQNAGLIRSFGKLKAQIASSLENLEAGCIYADEDLILTISGVVKNAGKIYSEDKLLLEVGELLETSANSMIFSKGKLVVDVIGETRNWGIICSDNAFTLKVGRFLQQYQSGQLNAKGALDVIAGSLSNIEGKIRSDNNLMINVRGILENKGEITAELQLALVAANVICNSGEIKSRKSAFIARAGVAFKNLAEGKLSALEKIKIFAEFIQEHHGLVVASQIDLEARQLMQSSSTATVSAKSSLSMQADIISHAGNANSDQLNLTSHTLRHDGTSKAKTTKIESDSMQNTGIVEGSELLTVQSHDVSNTGKMKGKTVNLGDLPKPTSSTASYFFNDGEVEAEKLREEHDVLWNEGSIKASTIDLKIRDVLWNVRRGNIEALKELRTLERSKVIFNEGTLLAYEVLQLYAAVFNLEGGELKAAKQAMICAMDVMLKGEIGTCRQICLVVSHHFSYENVRLGEDNQLEIVVSNKLALSQKIHTDGALTMTLLPEGWQWFHDQVAATHRFASNQNDYQLQIQQTHEKNKVFYREIRTEKNLTPNILQEAMAQLQQLGNLFAASFHAAKHPYVITPIGAVLSPYYQWWQLQPEFERNYLAALIQFMQFITEPNEPSKENSQASDLLTNLLPINPETGQVQLPSTSDLERFLKTYPLVAHLLSNKGSTLLKQNNSWQCYQTEKPYWAKPQWKLGGAPFTEIKEQGEFKLNGNLEASKFFTLNLPGQIVINNFDFKQLGVLNIYAAGFKNSHELVTDELNIHATHKDVVFEEGVAVAKEHARLNPQRGNLVFKNTEAYLSKFDAVAGNDVTLANSVVKVGERAVVTSQSFNVSESSVFQGTGLLGIDTKQFTVGGVENKPVSSISEYQQRYQWQTFMGDQPSPTMTNKPDSFAKVGSIHANDVSVKADSGHVTGYIAADADVYLAVQQMKLEKRQYRYTKFVENVYKSSSCFGLRRSERVEHVAIQCAESQPGGVISAKQRVVAREGDVFVVQGGELHGDEKVFVDAKTQISFYPNIDSSVQYSSSGRRNIWSGSSSSVHQARYTAQQAKAYAKEGDIKLLTEGEIKLISAQLLAKYDILLSAKKGIHLGATTFKIELPPQHFSKGLVSGQSTATTEYAIPTSMLSTAGKIKLSSLGKIDGDAPVLIAKTAIEVVGSDIAFRSLVLHHAQQMQMSGISGFNLVNHENQSTQESALQPLMSAPIISQRATTGDIYHQGTQFRCDTLKLLADEGDVRIEAVPLVNTSSSTTQSIGIEFFGSKALEASMRGDFALAAKTLAQHFLPPIAVIEEMLKSEDTADLVGTSIKSLYSTYKFYESVANAKSIQDYLKQRIEPRITINVQETTTQVDWITYALPWIQAREIVIQAGRDGILKGVAGQGWESVYIQAKRDVLIEAVQDKFHFTQESNGSSLDISPKGIVGFGVNWSQAESAAQRHLAQTMKVANDISLLAGREIGIKGIIVEAKHAFVEAEKIRVETVQDESHSEHAAFSFHTRGELAVAAGFSEGRWAQVQAGIKAETLSLKTNELYLKGAAILQTKQPEPSCAVLPTGETFSLYHHPIPFDLTALLAKLGIPRTPFIHFLQENAPELYRIITESDPLQGKVLLQQLLRDGLCQRIALHGSIKIILWSTDDEDHLRYVQTIGDAEGVPTFHLWVTPDFSHLSTLSFTAANIVANTIIAENVHDQHEEEHISVGISNGMLSADYKSQHKQGVNRATISSSINVITNTIQGELNRNASLAKETTQDKKHHIRVEVPLELAAKLFALPQQEPQIQIHLVEPLGEYNEMDEDFTEEDETPLEQETPAHKLSPTQQEAKQKTSPTPQKTWGQTKRTDRKIGQTRLDESQNMTFFKPLESNNKKYNAKFEYRRGVTGETTGKLVKVNGRSQLQDNNDGNKFVKSARDLARRFVDSIKKKSTVIHKEGKAFDLGYLKGNWFIEGGLDISSLAEFDLTCRVSIRINEITGDPLSSYIVGDEHTLFAITKGTPLLNEGGVSLGFKQSPHFYLALLTTPRIFDFDGYEVYARPKICYKNNLLSAEIKLFLGQGFGRKFGGIYQTNKTNTTKRANIGAEVAFILRAGINGELIIEENSPQCPIDDALLPYAPKSMKTK